MKTIHIPISPAELLDKITILRIKAVRITDPARLRNVQAELDELERVWREADVTDADVEALSHSLQRVNEQLWDIEDRIREKEQLAVSTTASFNLPVRYTCGMTSGPR